MEEVYLVCLIMWNGPSISTDHVPIHHKLFFEILLRLRVGNLTHDDKDVPDAFFFPPSRAVPPGVFSDTIIVAGPNCNILAQEKKLYSACRTDDLG